VRGGLSRLLLSDGWQVLPFGSALEFLEQLPEAEAGCILLDVNMPGLTGPELHEQLIERGISLPVIYLTGQCTVSMGVRAMKRGAVDFLEKPVDADALLPALEQAIARHRQARACSDRQGDLGDRLARLSARERQVLEHVISGRLNKQIAGDLGIAEKTVKVHRGRMMAKMQVRSVAALVHLCDELGLAAPSPTP
jgi:FixJ family two-component response regulator